MITIDKLKKNFGEKIAVDIEHYEINQGDMLGLVGNNGAGKTTLFRLMLDLLKADNGKVVINDIDVSLNEDWKAFTGAFIDSGFLIIFIYCGPCEFSTHDTNVNKDILAHFEEYKLAL